MSHLSTHPDDRGADWWWGRLIVIPFSQGHVPAWPWGGNGRRPRLVAASVFATASVIGVAALASMLAPGGAHPMVIPAQAAEAGYQIQITRCPPRGAGPESAGTIKGTASGADVNQLRVIVYAITNKAYVQPTANAPFTLVKGGQWTTATHLGWRYAAILCRKTYQAPAVAADAPPVGGDVLAVAETEAAATPARATPARTLSFSGYEWWVKQSEGPVGPGPNLFGGGADNVWVDARGRLHLKITRRKGVSRCAEVVLTRSLGYGIYRFYLESRPPADPYVVLGLFTWNDEPAYTHREIDIELSRWGQPANQNAQFVVQPYQLPGHRIRFEFPARARQSVQSFTWSPGSVLFRSSVGRQDVADGGHVVREETLTAGIPAPGGENARINLWLSRGMATPGESDCEVVVNKFEFVPAGARS